MEIPKENHENEKIRINEKKRAKLDIVAKCGNMEMHKALHFFVIAYYRANGVSTH